MNDTETNLDNVADNAVEGIQSAWPSPGQKLKKRREDMGLSHARVADALHMTAHYVKALENDQYEKLPGKTFVKGYFRAYARLLGADVDDIMQCYQKYVEALEESEVSEANVIRARKAYDQNVRWLITAAVIIIVVVGVSWWLSVRQESEAAVNPGSNRVVGDAGVSRDNAQQAPVAAESESNTTAAIALTDSVGIDALAEDGAGSEQALDAEAPLAVAVMPAGNAATLQEEELPGTVPEQEVEAVVEADAIAQAQTAGVEDTVVRSTLPDYTVTRIDDHRLVQLETEGSDILEVHFSGTSWIEIDNADNARLYHDMLGNGDDLNIRGKAPFNILIGDANVVDVTFNSRQVQITRIRTDNSARILLEPETR